MIRFLLAISIFSFILAGCNGSDPEPVEETFDKEAMLDNIGRNVILPSYQELTEKLDEAWDARDAFELDRTSENYSALQDKVLEAHRLWQRCAPFEFGPAADRNLRLSVNTYPVDTSQINSNIETGVFDLDQAQNSDAKGFPALDYLLFSDDESAFEEAQRMGYLVGVLNQIDEMVTATYDEWNSDYAEEFAFNTGSDAGSSISFLVNEINFDFELVKNAKIGIPLGKKTLGITQTDQVETPYSRSSLRLARENLVALQDAFNGGSGSGLDDYLDHLDARYNQQLLSDAINDGFTEIFEAIDAINTDLVTAINDDPTSVEVLYTALQNQVVLLKTDMPSQLGIQITYQDNDGD